MSALERVPISDIYVNEDDNSRQTIDATSLYSLTESIKENDLIEPIVISPPDPDEFTDGKPWVIVSGFRRFRVHELEHMDTILAFIRPTSRKDRMFVNLIENVERKNLTFGEEAEAITKFCRFGYTAQDISKKTGQPISWVRARMMLLTLEAPIIKVANEGLLTQQNVMDIYRLKTPEERLDAVKTIRNAKEHQATAKIKVTPRETLIQRKEGTVQKVRSRSEINDVLGWLAAGPLPSGLYTKSLAWAAGGINDQEYLDELQKLADIDDIDWKRPKSLSVTDLI